MKIGTPKGTRDFSPEQMVKRNYIFDTIRKVYQRYGYQPIETPAMENTETLMGKYGEEGDRLIFRILNSGEKASLPSEKALKYDLTVPFARYVVQHRNEITFPFKRYQIQPVWRADRPQKGRYREFYQCDADVIGSDSLIHEAEFIQIIDEVFSRFGIKVLIKFNNRKVLTGIAEVIDEADKIIEITVALDKLDKTGEEGVKKEMADKGVSQNAIDKLQPLFGLSGSVEDKLSLLKEFLGSSETGLKGVAEIEKVLSYISDSNLKNSFGIEVTLARGLNYYTGAIIEVIPTEIKFSTICGGGRYDDLTGIFGMPDVSGMGISFGADRIYDVLEELKLFPDFSADTTRVLFINFGEDEERYCLKALQQLREASINSELYPTNAKMKKQMSYADSNKIPYVIMAGSNEIESGQLTLKNMLSGEQESLTLDAIINKLK